MARKYPFGVRLVRALFVMLAAWIAVAAGGAVRPSTVKTPPRPASPYRLKKYPIWAVQMKWSPSGNSSLSINYNSKVATLAGAYKTTASVFPAAGRSVWHTHTWKLGNVSFTGRENAHADLRLACAAGIAVHQVTLSSAAPSVAGRVQKRVGGSSASIQFASGAVGNNRNIDHGLKQVAAGGNVGDSKYACGVVAGRGAEIIAKNIGVSYIYLRLARRGKFFQAHPRVVYATVTWAAMVAPAPWPQQTFARLKAQGIDYAELNIPWGQVEPGPNKYQFRTLDMTLAHAALAHVRIIPIFMYSVWPGNPARWVSRYDVGSSGAAAAVPTWWSRFNRRSYFNYVIKTIAHIKNSPAYGGAFLDFGWLDYMWGPPPSGKGVNGYAAQDVARFHRWLPAHYHSLAAFNTHYGTRFSSWGEVPAATPGQRLFSVYQHFRNWSVRETYGRLTAMVRRETSAPLYYYWGGGFSGAGIAFNLPDSFFQLAQRYHVTVCEDCADHTGLMLLFGSLAKAYKVPLFEEWTPRPRGLHAEIAQFMGHYGLGAPREVGMDFFLYHGGPEYKVGFPQYVKWLPILSNIQGTYPQQPVAVYVTYQGAFTKPGALGGMADHIAKIWRMLHIAFTVVTDREVKAGVVRLARFHAIFPLNGQRDAALAAYAARGGHVLSRAAQLAHYAPEYLTLKPANETIEAVPTVDAAKRTAWMTLCDWQFGRPYHGMATVHWRALGLPPGRYKLINATTGRPVTTQHVPGGLRAPLVINKGQLLLWQIRPEASGK